MTQDSGDNLETTVRAIAARHQATPGGLLPALHAVQDALGHVPAAGVPAIADVFNLTRAEVHGVVTYYHHFRGQPAGRHVLQVCRAEACQAMGADALLAHAQARLGCALHGTTADGAVTLEPVYCLGLCASSPAVMLDDEPHARVTPGRLDALLDEARSRP
jgi:formate dehydrogenase subunit gamma